MIESEGDRERRWRRTGRRGMKRRLLRRIMLIILLPLIVVLIWNYDYRGISLWEWVGIALAGILTVGYFATGIQKKPIRGWAKIEQERREAQRIRKRRSRRSSSSSPPRHP